jgi:hypothetical protein
VKKEWRISGQNKWKGCVKTMENKFEGRWIRKWNKAKGGNEIA